MSADNWAVCPPCYKAAIAAKADLQRRAESGYGKLDVNMFLQLVADAKKVVDPDDYQTLREDYEFYMNIEGDLDISYSASCAACGAKFDYQHVIEGAL